MQLCLNFPGSFLTLWLFRPKPYFILTDFYLPIDDGKSLAYTDFSLLLNSEVLTAWLLPFSSSVFFFVYGLLILDVGVFYGECFSSMMNHEFSIVVIFDSSINCTMPASQFYLSHNWILSVADESNNRKLNFFKHQNLDKNFTLQKGVLLTSSTLVMHVYNCFLSQLTQCQTRRLKFLLISRSQRRLNGSHYTCSVNEPYNPRYDSEACPDNPQ